MTLRLKGLSSTNSIDFMHSGFYSFIWSWPAPINF